MKLLPSASQVLPAVILTAISIAIINLAKPHLPTAVSKYL